MLPPKTPQNGSRNQARTPSSKPSKNVSKPKCDPWSTLNGWEQGDQAESDIFYLAIDSWTKRNAKIKPDAPKGVPSAKIWEPFLCTTSHQCTGIPDYDAFVNVSMCLHTEPEEPPEDITEKGPSNTKETSKTNNGQGQEIGPGESGKSENVVGEQHRKENLVSNSSSSITVPDCDVTSDKNERTSRVLEVDMVTHGPTPLEGGDGGDLEPGENPETSSRISSSRSAPVSRTQQREPVKRRVGSAKSRSAEDKLRRAALRNSAKSNATTKKLSVLVNPVKISYAHSNNPRAGIFAGDLPMNGTEDLEKSAESDDNTNESTNSPERRSSVERRLLIEQVIRDTKKTEYIPKTSHVIIGDLLSSSPRLERRHGNERGSVYSALKAEDELTSSRESFHSWPSGRYNDEGAASLVNESSLPPVPAAVIRSKLPRDIHSTPSSQQMDGGKAGSRVTMNLNSARIPTISYRKVSRRAQKDSEGTENGDEAASVKYEHTLNPEEARYLKRLLKNALARHNPRVRSADYVRQGQQVNEQPQNVTRNPTEKKREEKHKRGPPGFRPQNFKTPLQRAVENAHKKIYGQHYYLFNNSGVPIPEGADEIRNIPEHPKGLRTKSANGDVMSAYVWKENIESQLQNKRKANPTNVQIGEIHDIRWQSKQQQTTWSSLVEHYVKHTLATDHSGVEKNRLKLKTTNGVYNVSDFKPNFKADTLKTERKKTIQR